MAFNKKQLSDTLRDEQVDIIVGEDLQISRPSSIETADASSIIWLKPGNAIALEQAKKCNAGLIICDKAAHEFLIKENVSSQDFIISENPKRIFSKIANSLLIAKPQPGIHPTAVIHEDAKIGEQVYIGPNTVIGACTIGNNTVIHGNCYLFDCVIMGNNVILNPGVVIGSDGFGYSKDDAGNVEKFPHLGRVVIMDNVEIGANSCIDRGALSDTVIHAGVKIDNLVHVAHNVVIHENSFIIANAMLGGSTEIGKNVWVAPSASILQQLKIGANATIGVGAVVTKNIPAEETWAGAPARPISEFIAIQKKIKDSL